MLPVNQITDFFDNLLAIQAELLKTSKGNPREVLNFPAEIHELMLGEYPVDIAKNLGLITSIQKGNTLKTRTVQERRIMANRVHRRKNQQRVDKLNEKDLYEIENDGVRLLSGLVRRYANSSYRSTEKMLNSLGKFQTAPTVRKLRDLRVWDSGTFLCVPQLLQTALTKKKHPR